MFETKVPFHIKGKIDSKFNVNLTAKKQINEYSSISYGMGLLNLFQKKFRLQTGLVYEFNAWSRLVSLFLWYNFYFKIKIKLYLINNLINLIKISM